ncbi:hypothetical protein Nther_2920 [Natranaerobius thermophilus JW/NM-WN-LF]|uniref:Uncharacterized protein n=1 Tax=Natranaerobius thermophilus (strain ATCC BAA-1301 / DSM 18059 / JW/NM-WN-LF) TaxID=457570 RepID=B2A460_NATTJ|nr:hypothetical protein Nther_2920 [Natranaerobius thermophilus JW/NM-WN-LF]
MLLAFLISGIYLIAARFPYLANPYQYFGGGPEITEVSSLNLTQLGINRGEIEALGFLETEEHWYVKLKSNEEQTLLIYDQNLDEVAQISTSSGELFTATESVAKLQNDRLTIYNGMGEKRTELSVSKNDELLFFSDDSVAFVTTDINTDHGEIEYSDKLRFYDLIAEDFIELEFDEQAILHLNHYSKDHRQILTYTTISLDKLPENKLSFYEVEHLEFQDNAIELREEYSLNSTPIGVFNHGDYLLALKETEVLIFEDYQLKGLYESDHKIRGSRSWDSKRHFLVEELVIGEGVEDRYKKIVMMNHQGDVKNDIQLRGELLDYNYSDITDSFLLADENSLYQLNKGQEYIHRAPWKGASQGTFTNNCRYFFGLIEDELKLFEISGHQ